MRIILIIHFNIIKSIKFYITFSAEYDRKKCPDGFKFGSKLESSNYTYNNNIITNFRSILFFKNDGENNIIVAEAIPEEDSSTNDYSYLTPTDPNIIHTTFKINHN